MFDTAHIETLATTPIILPISSIIVAAPRRVSHCRVAAVVVGVLLLLITPPRGPAPFPSPRSLRVIAISAAPFMIIQRDLCSPNDPSWHLCCRNRVEPLAPKMLSKSFPSDPSASSPLCSGK